MGRKSLTMTFPADTFLLTALNKRKEQNSFRKLITNTHSVDFCSNDYLGFARDANLLAAIENEFAALTKGTNNTNMLGSTGSRLLAGNSTYAEQLEKELAEFHKTNSALIYNSGYDANVGLFSSIGQKHTTIIYDELIHASVHDGIRMSQATAFMFRHNDLEHLEERLKIAEGIIYVAVESIYSMDGDAAPLRDIAALCEKYNASFIVDEAHATGITSNSGAGMIQLLGLQDKVFARVHTFGKGLGTHGAAILGSKLLRDYMVNFSRSFIYTTALPLKSLVAIHQSYQLLQKDTARIQQLQQNISLFKQQLSQNKNIELLESNSAIQCIVCSGNDHVKILATAIQNEGFDVRPILSPTVPRGKERLRICIHSFNTKEQIIGLSTSILKHI